MTDLVQRDPNSRPICKMPFRIPSQHTHNGTNEELTEKSISKGVFSRRIWVPRPGGPNRPTSKMTQSFFFAEICPLVVSRPSSPLSLSHTTSAFPSSSPPSGLSISAQITPTHNRPTLDLHLNAPSLYYSCCKLGDIWQLWQLSLLCVNHHHESAPFVSLSSLSLCLYM